MKNDEKKKKETKVVRGYSLSPVNLKWLKAKTLRDAEQTGKMSVSETLDEMLTAAREEEETLTLPSPLKGEGKTKGKA